MKRTLRTLCAASLCTTTLAHADPVTIYGLIDAGLTRYSDSATAAGGPRQLTKMDTGVANANRIGFKGVEQLGDGLSAFFTLETGYTLDDGALGQGGLIFGRQAFVGLANQYGSVSVGRHYDFMINQNAYSTGAATVAGLLAFGLHASPRTAGVLNDRIYAGDRVNNSVKFQSRAFGGWSVGALYGIGEVAGNSDAGRTYSVRVAYDAGPASAALAMTDLRDAAGVYTTRIYGLGGSYQVGSVRAFSLLTHVRNNSGRQLEATNAEVGATWAAAPLVDLSAGVQRQSRNNAIGSAHQLTLVANYKFSARTNVYAVGAFLRDRGFPAQTTAAVGVPDADGTQNALRIGIRHLF
ncbi:porin [Pseudoduganella albidiflava]|uniref:Porin n=1 Tax=Pseudoduganella albidiflava TaxID=321983 RepID=A0A411WVK6_9BURK|nr:porin [Pseudoduganella albidiflava]QBI00795.1 porin [Pseudoduganella albidiflava]GGY30715.1 porin [Pseudoduganella albidiflava]